jgi:toxin CcdB
MAQFTLYENLNPTSNETYPYFVDVQNDLLDPLNTRLVVPLVRSTFFQDKPIDTLCPTISQDGRRYVLLTHQMTNVPISALSTPVCSLEHLRDEIVAAIDFMVTGI